MLATGSCCCRAATVLSLAPGEDLCCAERTQTAEGVDHCGCAGQVQISAKTEMANVAPVVVSGNVQGFEFFAVAVRPVPNHLSVRPWTVPPTPPPGHRQRLLRVWLI